MSEKSRLKQRLADGRMRLPTRDELAVKLQQVAKEKSEWAGIPMILTDFPLTLEPRYPYRLHIDTTDIPLEGAEFVQIFIVNNMKIRIIKRGNRFIPQVKGWFFWHGFCSPYGDEGCNEEFDTIEEAKQVLNRYMRSSASIGESTVVWTN